MAKLLFIKGRNDGYEPSQCSRTMTAGDLIEYLSQFDGDTPVYLRNDGGYTYGSIDNWSFMEGKSEEEDEDDEEATNEKHEPSEELKELAEIAIDDWYSEQKAKYEDFDLRRIGDVYFDEVIGHYSQKAEDDEHIYFIVWYESGEVRIF